MNLRLFLVKLYRFHYFTFFEIPQLSPLQIEGIVHDTMAVASYLKFHPNLSKHGGGTGEGSSELQPGISAASVATAKQEAESQRQRQRLVFVT